MTLNGSDYTLAPTFNETGTHMELTPLGDTPPAGKYNGVVLRIGVIRNYVSETLEITLPTLAISE